MEAEEQSERADAARHRAPERRIHLKGEFLLHGRRDLRASLIRGFEAGVNPYEFTRNYRDKAGVGGF